jgi:long-chain acyl-CoA synthetase
MPDGSGRSWFRGELARQAREGGSRLAVRSESERLSATFADLEGRVSAWTSTLSAAGLSGDGAAVALAAGNSIAFIELFFALRSLGVPVLCMDGSLPLEAMTSMASGMGACGVLQRQGGVPLGGGIRLERTSPARPLPRGTEILKLTSGSTVAPRAACFTEAALAEGIRHILEGMEIVAEDRVLVSIPLSHSYGFDSGVLSLAVGGTPLILQPDVLPGALLGSIREHGATFFPAVPALVRALSQVAWPKPLSLRKVICASAPLSPEAAEEFLAASGLRVHQFLGSTETGGISFETRPGEEASRGCVGFPLPGVSLEIDGEGLLRVRSAANRFAVIPEEPVTPEVATGDRAERTPEGRLRLLGRASLTANVGGVKVDLGALDAFLRGLPGVEEAAALPVDDPARGHRVVAFVEGRSCTPADLMEACRKRLSPKEVPSAIRVVERLPRTERGKPDRAALAEQARCL